VIRDVRGRLRPQQLKLGALPALPSWTDLPPTNRDEIMSLLIDMIRAHVLRANHGEYERVADE
jgi:hypothetical protein